MPGQTPDSAYERFAKPIRRAIGCIDSTANFAEISIPDTNKRLISSPSAKSVRLDCQHTSYEMQFSLTVQTTKTDTGYKMTTRR